LGVVAEDLERWTERTPHLFNRAPAFGLAREAGQLDGELPPAPVEDDPPRRPRREKGPFLTYLNMPWSYGDREERHFWHRLRCRLGRHELHGGHPMQVAGEVVYLDRRCRWCDAEPPQDGWNSASA
jgi:hypothetical protein